MSLERRSWTPTFHHGYILQTGGDPANIFMANCTHFIRSFFEQAFDACQLTQPNNRSLTGPISTAYYDNSYDISSSSGGGYMAIRNQRLLAELGVCDPEFSVSTMLDTISASITGAVNCLEQYFNNFGYAQCKPKKPVPIGEDVGLIFGIPVGIAIVMGCVIATITVLSIYLNHRRKQYSSTVSDTETTPLNRTLTRAITYDPAARDVHTKSLGAL